MKLPETPPNIKELLPEINKDDFERYHDVAEQYNRRYLHWEDLEYRCDSKVERRSIWTLMKLMRAGNLKIGVGNILLNYALTADFQKILHDIDIRSSAGKFPGEKLTEREKSTYAVSSIMEESIASSQIEGAATTRAVAKKMLREKRKPRNRSERMIVNSYLAMEFIAKNKDRELTPELILDIHKIIVNGTIDEPKYEGVFRDYDDIFVENAYTGEVYHQSPFTAEMIPQLMRDLCSFVNNEEDFTHPIVKGIILHFLIGYIHAFHDGNGRLARSLFYWFLLKNDYWIIEYLSLSRKIKEHLGGYEWAYLYTESDNNDVTYFIQFNLSVMNEALSDFIKYLKKKRDEFEEMELQTSADHKLPIRQQSILANAIKTGEAFTIQEMATMYQVTYQTARIDVKTLEEKGLIKEAGKQSNQLLYKYNKGKTQSQDESEKYSNSPKNTNQTDRDADRT